jgi:predicted dinucleotide-binding enzyme
MKIGIVGAGHIGGTLTRRLTALGHEVSVANSRAPETLAELAAETGAKAVLMPDAPRDAELVIVTIPEYRVPDLPADLLVPAAPGFVLVDTGNYYPQQRDGEIAAIEQVDELGFDPVDAGELGESWRQQPGTPVYGTDLDADGVRRALAQASPERPPEFRADGAA